MPSQLGHIRPLLERLKEDEDRIAAIGGRRGRAVPTDAFPGAGVAIGPQGPGTPRRRAPGNAPPAAVRLVLGYFTDTAPSRAT
jgi:hypothetical protein